MSNTSQEPGLEDDMDTPTRENHLFDRHRSAGDRAGSARLQAIHDLIRSGDYHIPAEVIADRIVERIIAEKHRPAY
jgi:anti-sigma28 factor (negative regulator of flagellin synthesis)